MEMKSVPPLVASGVQADRDGKAADDAADTLKSSGSAVTGTAGITSTRTLLSSRYAQESSVNFRPMKRNAMTTGTALSSRFTSA